MTPAEAEDLATRAQAGIQKHVDVLNAMLEFPEAHPEVRSLLAMFTADRERVASDLAGLREHYIEYADRGTCVCGGEPCTDAARYAAGLRRTAAMYGAKPQNLDSVREDS